MKIVVCLRVLAYVFCSISFYLLLHQHESLPLNLVGYEFGAHLDSERQASAKLRTVFSSTLFESARMSGREVVALAKQHAGISENEMRDIGAPQIFLQSKGGVLIWRVSFDTIPPIPGGFCMVEIVDQTGEASVHLGM
jgi:hypothetical protein